MLLIADQVCLIVSIDEFCPSQQLLSFRDVTSSLWDFYPTSECYDKCLEPLICDHPSKHLILICMMQNYCYSLWFHVAKSTGSLKRLK